MINFLIYHFSYIRSLPKLFYRLKCGGGEVGLEDPCPLEIIHSETFEQLNAFQFVIIFFKNV